MKKNYDEQLLEFKATGKYAQLWIKIRHLIDCASGYLPTTAAVRITPCLFITVIPWFFDRDYGIKKVQTGWGLCLITRDLDNGFIFNDNKIPDIKSFARKKDGKAKAAERFADFVILHLFKNDRKD